MDGTYLCKFHDKSWAPCLSSSTTMLLLLSALILNTVIEALRVVGGNMTVAQGGTIVLPCKLVDNTETVTQISWERMTRGKPLNQHFFTVLSTNGQDVDGLDQRFKFIGSITGNNGSLLLSDATLLDEGTYTCIFTLFPSGHHKTEIPLNLLVPPVSSLEDNHPALGNEKVSLVTCTAAGSKPPATVKWLTGTLAGLTPTTTSIENANGTTTTVSSLFGEPTRKILHHPVECVVTNAALSKVDRLPFNIQVYFPPLEVKIIERGKDSFECVAEANPSASLTWTRSDNSWPQSGVRVDGATLHFLSKTSDLNGVYQCTASNTNGTKQGHIYFVASAGGCSVCWVLFILLLLLNAAAAAIVCYLYKAGMIQWSDGAICRRSEAVPTTPRSPRNPDEAEEEEVGLNGEDIL